MVSPSQFCRVVQVVALAVIVAVVGSSASLRAEPQSSLRLTVFAPASLKTAMDEVMAKFRAETGLSVVASFAGTATLAKQIMHGAPADVFISADTAWMDVLAERRLIDPATRFDLVGNRLVLVVPAGSAQTPVADIADFDFGAALGDRGRLAVANVTAVPAGRYAKEALTTVGLWQAVQHRLAEAANVRAALALVAQDEAPFGIVYRSDAHAEPRVKVITTFANRTHRPIVYPAARVAGSANSREAARLLAFLQAAAEEEGAFVKHGFTPIEAGSGEAKTASDAGE